MDYNRTHFEGDKKMLRERIKTVLVVITLLLQAGIWRQELIRSQLNSLRWTYRVLFVMKRLGGWVFRQSPVVGVFAFPIPAEWRVLPQDAKLFRDSFLAR
jgi:hypothetical protein